MSETEDTLRKTQAEKNINTSKELKYLDPNAQSSVNICF
jgi:hypothetical protein